MRVMIGFIAIASLVMLSSRLAAQCSSPIPGAKATISVSLSASHQAFANGDPVLVKATLTNISDHDISLWIERGGGEAQYRVVMSGERGDAVNETKFGRVHNGHPREEDLGPEDLRGSGACATVKPGKSVVDVINVGKFYDLSRPGKYIVQVQRTDPQSDAVVKSNTITVTVTP